MLFCSSQIRDHQISSEIVVASFSLSLSFLSLNLSLSVFSFSLSLSLSLSSSFGQMNRNESTELMISSKKVSDQIAACQSHPCSVAIRVVIDACAGY